MLARAHQSLGDHAEAEQQFAQAIDLAPERLDLRLEYAKFLQPLEAERAEEVLRDVLKRDPNHVEARRLLASWLLWRVEPAARKESYSLLRRNPMNPEQQAANQRAQAMLLLRQGFTENVQEAIRLLEELVRDPAQATPDDHWLLANLYEQEDRFEETEQQLRWLVNQPEPNPRYLVAWIEFLLRQERVEEAQIEWRKLEQQAPENFTTIGLRAKLQQAQGQSDRMKAELEEYAVNVLQQTLEPSLQKRFMRQLAELYAAVGQPADGQRWYARLVDRFPEEREPYARFLLRQGDVRQAVQTCLQPLQSEPNPEAAARLVRLLVQVPQDLKLPPDIDALLEQQLAQHPRHPALLFAMSNWRLKQQRMPEAIELLQQLTAVDRHHYLAWNNLAALLAEDPDRLREALVAIDQAIAAAGQPLANLLDTKAVILLRQQRNAEAASLLLQAVSLPGSDDARFYLHLTAVLQRLGRNEQANETWHRAQELGLNEMFLTDFEKDLVAELRIKLAAVPDGA